MRRETKVSAEVLVGDGQVVIRRQTSSQVTLANILGVEEGGDRIYLDRLVHAAWEQEVGGWSCRGAVSTILERGKRDGA